MSEEKKSTMDARHILDSAKMAEASKTLIPFLKQHIKHQPDGWDTDRFFFERMMIR